MTDDQFADKFDDWATEGSNFHDLVGRSQLPLDSEVIEQINRFRDGTVARFTAIFFDDMFEKPGTLYTFTEPSLLKWMWVETHDVAFDKLDGVR